LKELVVEGGFPGMMYYTTVGLTKPHGHLLDIGDHSSQWNLRPQKAEHALSRYELDEVVSYPNLTAWNDNQSLEVPGWGCMGDAKDSRKQRIHDIVGIISFFDNTPRRNYKEAYLWSSDEPVMVVERFQKSLHVALYYETRCFPNDIEKQLKKKKDNDDCFVLINAMNELAEGIALEPSNLRDNS
jgi:hypothetical protein